MSVPTDLPEFRHPLSSMLLFGKGGRLFSAGILMKKRIFEARAAGAAAVVTLPIASMVWLVAVPGVISGATFAAISLLAVGGAYVGFNTWRNGQATEHIGHVLQRAEASAERTGRDA